MVYIAQRDNPRTCLDILIRMKESVRRPPHIGLFLLGTLIVANLISRCFTDKGTDANETIPANDVSSQYSDSLSVVSKKSKEHVLDWLED